MEPLPTRGVLDGRVALFYTLAIKRAESWPRSPGLPSPGLYFRRPPTVQDSVVIRQSRPGTTFHKRSGRKRTTKAMVADMPKKQGGEKAERRKYLLEVRTRSSTSALCVTPARNSALIGHSFPARRAVSKVIGRALWTTRLCTRGRFCGEPSNCTPPAAFSSTTTRPATPPRRGPTST